MYAIRSYYDHGEHLRGNADRLEDDARVEIHVGVQLLLDEVLVLEGDLLELLCQAQNRIVLHAQNVEHLVARLLV